MTDDWATLIETCRAWQVDPSIVIRPTQYMNQRDKTDREVILRELRRLKLTTQRIAQLCPLSERTLYRAFRHPTI